MMSSDENIFKRQTASFKHYIHFPNELVYSTSWTSCDSSSTVILMLIWHNANFFVMLACLHALS